MGGTRKGRRERFPHYVDFGLAWDRATGDQPHRQIESLELGGIALVDILANSVAAVLVLIIRHSAWNRGGWVNDAG